MTCTRRSTSRFAFLRRSFALLLVHVVACAAPAAGPAGDGGSGGQTAAGGRAGSPHADAAVRGTGGDQPGTGGDQSGGGNQAGMGGNQPGAGGDVDAAASDDATDIDAQAGDDGPPPDVSYPQPPPPDETPLVCTRMVPAAGNAGLATALAAAKPGDCIMLADGDYTAGSIGVKGSAEHPIVIRAGNRGKAVFATGVLRMTGADTVIDGITWTSSGAVVITDCVRCRITRSRFRPVGATDTWVTITGTKSDGNRIDHSDFGPKNNKGRMILPTGTMPVLAKHTRIDHNFFHDEAPTGSNGYDTIALGAVGAWGDYQDSFSVVEYNLFLNCDSDEEIISVKTSAAVVRYNTIRASHGMTSIRSGLHNQIVGNYILGDGKAGAGGIKLYEDDHLIYDNYVAAVEGYPLLIGSGTPRGPGFSHAVVRRAKIVNNTFIVTGKPLIIGHSSPLPVEDTVFANNILVGTVPLMSISVPPKNMTYLGNIASGPLGIDGGSGFKMVDPMLVKAGDLLTLAAGSPAVDGALGDFPFVTDDIDGQPRTKTDIGADELSAAPATRHLLTTADVGPDSP